MKIKSNVSIRNIRPQMVLAAMVVAQYCEEINAECTITSGDDGTHGADSLHPYGLALDFRNRDLTMSEKESMREQIAKRLGPDFDVVLESTHLHVEYDPD